MRTRAGEWSLFKFATTLCCFVARMRPISRALYRLFACQKNSSRFVNGFSDFSTRAVCPEIKCLFAIGCRDDRAVCAVEYRRVQHLPTRLGRNKITPFWEQVRMQQSIVNSANPRNKKQQSLKKLGKSKHQRKNSVEFLGQLKKIEKKAVNTWKSIEHPRKDCRK